MGPITLNTDHTLKFSCIVSNAWPPREDPAGASNAGEREREMSLSASVFFSHVTFKGEGSNLASKCRYFGKNSLETPPNCFNVAY